MTNTAEVNAQQFIAAANALGNAIDLVESLCRVGDALKDEESAADKIVVDGGDIVQALRVLAMRLDRAAVAAR